MSHVPRTRDTLHGWNSSDFCGAEQAADDQIAEGVEEIDSEAINKDKLKRLLKNLYVEASEIE